MRDFSNKWFFQIVYEMQIRHFTLAENLVYFGTTLSGPTTQGQQSLPKYLSIYDVAYSKYTQKYCKNLHSMSFKNKRPKRSSTWLLQLSNCLSNETLGMWKWYFSLTFFSKYFRRMQALFGFYFHFCCTAKSRILFFSQKLDCFIGIFWKSA